MSPEPAQPALAQGHEDAGSGIAGRDRPTRASMRYRGGWPFPTSQLSAADHTFEERQTRYEEMWARGGMHLAINSFTGVYVDEELNEEISEFVRDKIRGIVNDPDTAKKLMPSYPFGTKRLILDNGYFETYNRDNVALVDLRDDPIEAFTETSVRTARGEHPIDMLVLATGFDAVSGSMLRLSTQARTSQASRASSSATSSARNTSTG